MFVRMHSPRRGAAPNPGFVMCKMENNLAGIEKYKQFLRSSVPFERLIHVKRIIIYARVIGIDATLEHLCPLLSDIMSDNEPVIRQALGDQLGPLAMYLEENTQIIISLEESKVDSQDKMQGDNNHAVQESEITVFGRTETIGYKTIKTIIVQCIKELLTDDTPEVRNSARNAVLQVAKVLHGEDVGTIILTMVLRLAHTEDVEQQITAIQLMNALAPQLGIILCQNFVALELAAFAGNRLSPKVRQATAQNISRVCQMVGPEFTTVRILPSFVRLSKDKVVGVRKGCVDSMVDVARVVPPKVRAKEFIPMFQRFAKDSSRWVRNGAYTIMGPFLHLLGSDSIPSGLLKSYTHIPHMNSAVVDPEIHQICAYNFPAVVQTLGKSRWHELIDCFNTLVKYPKPTVRRCMSHSLHELAKILGREITELHLLPAFNQFLRDIETVRVGVIKNCGSIIRVISEKARTAYIKTLQGLQLQNESWRWRKCIAAQMGDWCELFSPEITATVITGLIFGLCRDEVAEVRHEAAKGMGMLINRLNDDTNSEASPEALAVALKEIRNFYFSHVYQDRQMFLRMCQAMHNEINQDLFEREFMPRLQTMVKDRVPNVRIILGRLLRDMKTHPYWSIAPSFVPMSQTIINDPDNDVSYYLNPPDILPRRRARDSANATVTITTTTSNTATTITVHADATSNDTISTSTTTNTITTPTASTSTSPIITSTSPTHTPYMAGAAG